MSGLLEKMAWLQPVYHRALAAALLLCGLFALAVRAALLSAGSDEANSPASRIPAGSNRRRKARRIQENYDVL